MNSSGDESIGARLDARKHGRWFLIAVAVAFLFPAFLAWNFLVAPMLNLQSRLRSVVGKTKSQAIEELGPPDSVQAQPGEGEVLEYRSATTQARVVIDRDGRVLRVDFGERKNGP